MRSASYRALWFVSASIRPIVRGDFKTKVPAPPRLWDGGERISALFRVPLNTQLQPDFLSDIYIPQQLVLQEVSNANAIES